MRLRHGVLYSSMLSGANRAPVSKIQNPYFVINVVPHWFQEATLTWRIPSDWGNCLFNVYRSRGEMGPFEKLNTTPIDNLFYNVTNRQWSQQDHDFYIVEAILMDKGGATLKSAPETWQFKQNRFVEIRANEIQRRYWLLLRKFVGSDSYVFKRRTYGKRCNTCWDRVNLKVTNDRCPECYGTGWSTGYLSPYKTYLQYDITPNNTVLTPGGRSEPNTIQAVTISFPEIDDWDLIYRIADRKIYRVDVVNSTELQTKQVSQRVNLIELPRNYVEYTLIETLGL